MTGATTEQGAVYRLLRQQANRFPDNDLFVLPRKVAALWHLERTSWRYAEVLALVDAAADRYRRAGFGPGHRVALMLENRPQHFFHLLALNATGASAVPLNPDATADELDYLLTHSGCGLVVALEAHAGRAAARAAAAGIVAVAETADPFPEARAAGGAAGGEAAILYTSGSTGRPKGCVLSDDYFLGWAAWYRRQGGLMALREGRERLMTPLPAFHVNATCHSFMGMLGVGGTQVIVDRFHPRAWWAAAAETGATCFHYLGVIPAILLELPASDLDRAHGLRFGHGGGVHPDNHAAFEARFGVPLLEGWTMTEIGAAGLHCANDAPRHVGTRCIGRTPDRVETRLVDDDGALVGDGAVGELLIRARGADPRRGFASGYLKDASATEALWAGGWLHTGDAMRRGPDGSLHFVDRRKNIIRRSGENIAAVEVEAVIARHPGVAKVAVVPADDRLREEEVLAVVVAVDGEAPGEALARSIQDHCAASLAYFKLPGYVLFLDDLPVTATQKVRKSELSRLRADPASEPGCHDLRAAKQARRERQD